MDSETEYDSDIEIIEQPHSEVETRMEIDSPIKSLRPVDQSTPIPTARIKTNRMVTPKSEPTSPAAAKGKTKQSQEIFVKPKPPSPVTIVPSNDSNDKQPPEIPSGSFYGKKKPNAKDLKKVPIVLLTPLAPPSAPKRARRASAQTALGNIRKTMNESQFDFDENENGEVELKRKRTVTTIAQPKRSRRTKKATEPPKWPVLDIEINKAKNGKKEPKKLFTIDLDMNDLNDDDKSAPKTPKMVKRARSHQSSELTPAGFRGSVYGDPKKVHNQILENVMKINERAHKKDQNDNLNASFSYRRAATTSKKHQTPSQVIYSQADSTSPNAVSNYHFDDEHDLLNIFLFFFFFQEQIDQRKNDAEFNQIGIDNDDDGMDVDVTVDINSNNEKDAHHPKQRLVKELLKEIKQSVNRAIDLVGGDESDGAGDDDDKSSDEH